MNQERPSVTMALDDHMVYAFCVLTHALTTNAKRPFTITVGFFREKLSAKNLSFVRMVLDQMEVSYELRELTPHELFSERRHLTVTTFSKFLLSDTIVGTHLWLDVDTIVRPEWDLIFDEIDAAPAGSGIVVAKMLTRQHNLTSGFNAGVLGWTSDARADWEPVLAKMPRKRFSSEQHVFNMLYAQSAHQIDVSYNFLSGWFRQQEQLDAAKIIHFSGPVKPWHLPRRHRKSWLAVNRSWEAWFSAEQSFRQAHVGTALSPHLRRAARVALFSGRLHTGKGALAGWVMRAISLLGPLAHPVVRVIMRRVTR